MTKSKLIKELEQFRDDEVVLDSQGREIVSVTYRSWGRPDESEGWPEGILLESELE